MDFNDTPEEAKFRAEVRAWLKPMPSRKTRSKARAGRSNKAEADRLASARSGRPKSRSRLRRHYLADRVWRSGRLTDPICHLFAGRIEF